MKKFSKVLALILAICTIAGCLIACGKNNQTIYSVLREAGEIESFEYTLSINSDANMSELTGVNVECSDIQISGLYKNAKEMTMEIKYRNDTKADYTPLTDAYVIDDVIYINLRSTINGISSLMGADIGTEVMSSITADYAKIDMAELASETEEETEDINTKSYENFVHDIYNIVVDYFEKTVKDVEPAAVTSKDGKFTFTVSNENVEQLTHNLANVIDTNIDKNLDDLILKYEAKTDNYNKEIVDMLKEYKETELPGLKESLKELKEYKYEEEGTFSNIFTVELTGKKGNRQFNSSIQMKTNNEEETTTTSFTCSIKENNKIKELKAPENVMTEEEIESALSLVLGGMMGNYGYDEEYYDDYSTEFYDVA